MKYFCRLAAACLSLFPLFISSAQAGSCFDLSPTLQANGDIYTIPEPEQLSRQEDRYVDKLFVKLEGEWKGSVSRTECLGTETNPRQKKSKAKITLKITEQGSNSLRLLAEIYKPKVKSTYRESFSLHQADGYLRIDSRSPAGDAEKILISRNELVVLQRYFVRNQQTVETPEEKSFFRLPDFWIQPVPEREMSIQPVAEVTYQPVQQRSLEDFDRERSKARKAKDEESVVIHGGTMNELTRRIKKNGSVISIETTLYTNGYLASYEHWQLRES